MVFNEGTMTKKKKLEQVDSMTPKKMKKLRTEAGMNQYELANAIGVKQPTICRYETGARDIPTWAAKLITIVTSPVPQTKSA